MHRVLTRTGKITPQPKKRPRSSYIRFQADLPNECWQSDFTHYRLANGIDVEIISWLDDHARYALSVTAHLRITGPIVLATFCQSVATHGIPASTLTDNGMVYTTRLAGGRGGRNSFENELRRLGITQKNSRPNHPTTCGKIERFQQTLKNWLRRQVVQPATIVDRTAHTPTGPPPPLPTTGARKLSPAIAAATPTGGSAATSSTNPDGSPCAITADYTTSASDEPAPEPASFCSSTTSRSPSSWPSPAKSSAPHPRHQPRLPTPKPQQHEPHLRVRTVADVSRHHRGALGRIRTCAHGSGGRCSIP